MPAILRHSTFGARSFQGSGTRLAASPDDLQVVEHGVERLRVFRERLVAQTARIVLDALDRLQDVGEVNVRVTRHR